jgi:hypothetical protein
MTRNAINAIAEQNEDEEDDDDDVPQNEMDGPKGGLTLTTEAVDADNDNDNNNGNDNNMSVDRGRTVLGLEFEGQGYTPSTTITPAFAPLMDPIKSTTGSIILTSLESGPGSGQNQVAGVGSGAGQGSGLNRGYKDKDMSVLILGTCALPCTALIL